MTALEKIKFLENVLNYFKQLPFYNKPIEKPKIKHIKNVDLLVNYLFMKN